MLKYLVLTVATVSGSFMHPLHVSVCEVEYDRESRSLEIIQRIFVDDLEKEIRLSRGEPELDIILPDNGLSTDQLVKDYLVKRLKFTVNDKEAEFTYLGYEVEGDAILCYIEIEKVKRLKSVKIYSDILSDLFDDQVNIVHVEVDNEIRSMKLTRRHRQEEFLYN